MASEKKLQLHYLLSFLSSVEFHGLVNRTMPCSGIIFLKLTVCVHVNETNIVARDYPVIKRMLLG